MFGGQGAVQGKVERLLPLFGRQKSVQPGVEADLDG
jgi:hypothetical protein